MSRCKKPSPSATQEGDTFQFLGTAYQQTEDRAKALESYTQAIDHGCNAALLSRGWLHYLMSNAPLAIEDFNKAIELKIDLPQAYIHAATSTAGCKTSTSRSPTIPAPIDADPKSIAAYDARARLRNEVIGDFHGAIDDFTRAIEINPGSPAAYGARGVIYIEHRDYDKGIADVKEAIRLNPQDLGQTYEPSHR